MARPTTTATVETVKVWEQTNEYSRLRELKAMIVLDTEADGKVVTWTTANINAAKEAKGEARKVRYTLKGREWKGMKVATRLAFVA